MRWRSGRRLFSNLGSGGDHASVYILLQNCKGAKIHSLLAVLTKRGRKLALDLLHTVNFMSSLKVRPDHVTQVLTIATSCVM